MTPPFIIVALIVAALALLVIGPIVAIGLLLKLVFSKAGLFLLFVGVLSYYSFRDRK
jgi:hypothetical protein